MLLYSKPSQYALRAISYIVRNKDIGPCQALKISREEAIPKPFLSKILKRLVEAKILLSYKGPGGGFLLGKEPTILTLFDVVSVFDDIDGDLKHCAIGWTHCSDDEPCNLHTKYKKLREHTAQYLKNTHLSVFTEAIQWKKTHATTHAI